jgi:hypothetical protein
MKSTEIQNQIDAAIARRDDLAAKIETGAAALDELRLSATASGDITRLRDALATQNTLADMVAALDREITALRFDCDSAGRAERRAELLDKLKARLAEGDQTWRAVDSAWIESQESIKAAACAWNVAKYAHRIARRQFSEVLFSDGADEAKVMLELLRDDGWNLSGVGSGGAWCNPEIYDCTYAMPEHADEPILRYPLTNVATWLWPLQFPNN